MVYSCQRPGLDGTYPHIQQFLGFPNKSVQWSTYLFKQMCAIQSRERRLLCWFEYNHVASSQRRSQFPSHHYQRVVPLKWQLNFVEHYFTNVLFSVTSFGMHTLAGYEPRIFRYRVVKHRHYSSRKAAVTRIFSRMFEYFFGVENEGDGCEFYRLNGDISPVRHRISMMTHMMNDFTTYRYNLSAYTDWFMAREADGRAICQTKTSKTQWKHATITTT